MGVYNVHAGHCPQGKGASGASGYLKESVENRLVKDILIAKLRNAGHTVYDCTDDSNCTASQNLSNIVSKCNAHNVDLDVSIHLNAGGGTGVETLIYNSKTAKIAERISKEVSNSLAISNRGVKTRTGLYVLRHTKAPALLVECCFVDSQNDYNKWNIEKCAEAIFKGITGQSSNLKGEWIYENNKYWFKHPDGSYTTNGWEKIDDRWYYFGNDGYMLTGWQHINGNYYYLNEEHDGTFGAMLTGWQYIDGNYFYLGNSESGAMYENAWHIEHDSWYYLKAGGYMAHDETLKIGDETFYFTSEGHMARTNNRGALV